MNKRRRLAFALCAGSLVAPLVSFAQQQNKVWRVGYLTLVHQNTRARSLYGEFLHGMAALGYIEGKNLAVELRSAEGNLEILPELAIELVGKKVDVIISNATSCTKAAQKATTTIPIVMVNHNNPVGDGLIASLARPGANITGLSSVGFELYPKHLELLRSISGRLARIAVIKSFGSATQMNIVKNLEGVGGRLGIKVVTAEVRDNGEIAQTFSDMSRQKVGAVIVLSDGFLNGQRGQIAQLALKHRMLSIALIREFPESGGLMSYGPNYADNFRRAATYVDKIFKGTRPGDIPVEQPTKLEMLINGKTAKALGLKIPQSLLVMADKVIE